MAVTEQRTTEKRAALSFFQRLRYACSQSRLTRFFTDTDVLRDDTQERGLFSRLFGKLIAFSAIKKTRQFLVRQVEQSRIIRAISRFAVTLLHTPLRSFGMLFLSFGVFLVTASLIFPDKYQTETQILTWVIAAVFILCALLLLFSQKSLSATIRDSRFCSFLFFSVLGVRRNTVEQELTVKTSDALAFLCGIFLAIPSLFLQTPTLLAIYALTVFGYLTLLTPESGLVLLLFLLPFCSTKFVCYAFLFLFVTFLLKVLLSKRIIRFHRMDYPILLFLLALLICGSVSADPAASVTESLLYVFLLCGYFLVTNLVKTLPWLRRCIFALSLSACLTALDGIAQFVLGKVSDRWQDQALFAALRGRAVATFDNPNVLAEYLILVLPILLALFLLQCKEKKPLWALPALLAVGVCLVFTWSRGAWLAALVSCALFCLFAGKRSRIIFLSIAAAFLISYPWLPDVFTARVESIVTLSDSSNAYRLQIWRGSLDNLRQFWHTGIGFGDEVFTMYYGHFAPSGAEIAAHSHQLFLQIWISLGIIGFLLFAWVLVYFLRTFTLLQKGLSKVPNVSARYYSFAFFSAICALMIHGLTDYVFYQPRIFFLFFAICALFVSMQRMYFAEHHRPQHSHSTVSAYSVDLPHQK